jgi:nitrate/TMAO reductase-like tetraheme cytochrome c subunit
VTLTALAWATTVAPDARVPRPEGWIGTSEQWAHGLGVALALVNLLVLVLAWRRLGSADALRPALGLLLMGLVVLPVVVIFFGFSHGMTGMENVRACGGCHVMASYVKDLRNPASQGLAAIHATNRYIREHECYTCHSDYGMLGTLSAKMDGVRHVVHYVAHTYTRPLKIAHPYPNVRCLDCHAGAQKFEKSAGHPSDVKPQLMSGEMACLDCHGPAHTPKETGR